MRTVWLTAITMIFFAANSLLARLALRGGEIDGGSYTAVRIIGGAAALAALIALRKGGVRTIATNGSLRAALALFAYAIAFSMAYLSLDAGTGALILFAAVQITMLGAGIARGERPRVWEWIGLAVAFSGLVYLVLPGLSAPSPVGVVLMAVSGISWGLYSLEARSFRSPIDATAGNFVRASPLALIAFITVWAVGRPHASRTGIALATVSGAITSGLGYVIWYTALKGLRTSRAAIVQLTVPVLAGIGGVLFLGERLTVKLVLSASIILGGVALALAGKTKRAT